MARYIVSKEEVKKIKRNLSIGLFEGAKIHFTPIDDTPTSPRYLDIDLEALPERNRELAEEYLLMNLIL